MNADQLKSIDIWPLAGMGLLAIDGEATENCLNSIASAEVEFFCLDVDAFFYFKSHITGCQKNYYVNSWQKLFFDA